MLKCGSVHGKIRIEYNGEILAKLQEAPSLNLVVWSKGRLPFRMLTRVLFRATEEVTPKIELCRNLGALFCSAKFGSSRSGLNSGICRVK